jgi:hypothetical protein
MRTGSLFVSTPPESPATTSGNDRPPETAPAGLADQARRWRRRTTDLLAIGLLLVIGLAVGRQLTAWWNEPTLQTPTTTSVGAIAGQGTAWSEPDDLQLGSLAATVHRRRVVGDRQQAWTAVDQATRAMATAAGWPDSQPDQAERGLLERLSRRTAANTSAEREPGISVFRIVGPLPMAVAVRTLLGQERVVGWGLATPTLDGAWVTWTFAAASVETSDPVTLPLDSQRLLALGDDDRQRLVLFSGPSGSNGWLGHFRRELTGSGWQAVSLPTRHDSGWTARWHHRSGRTAVVSSRRDTSGRWHGMLNIFTPTADMPDGTKPTVGGDRETT